MKNMTDGLTQCGLFGHFGFWGKYQNYQKELLGNKR